MAKPKSRFDHPDNKRRSDGGKSMKDADMRVVKPAVANGKTGTRHQEIGNGSQRLQGRRLWRWIMGDDEE